MSVGMKVRVCAIEAGVSEGWVSGDGGEEGGGQVRM